MEPGFRILARAKAQNALETLFADEDPRAATAKAAHDTNRQSDALDLQVFADEWKPPPTPAPRPTRPAISISSPFVVVLLVALLGVASPLLLSRHREPERSSPMAVIALDAGEQKASAPPVPVATTSKPIAAAYAPRLSEPIAGPPAPTRRAEPKVTAPPVRETSRPRVTNTPPTSRASVSSPPKPAVIPALQTSPRTIDTLGTLPVSPVAPPVPAPVPAPPPPAADARPRAPSADLVDQRAGVLATLRRYEAAYSALDAPAVRSVWPTVNQGALSRAFESLASQNIRLGNCAVTVRAPTARAVCVGAATWVPRIGGGKQREDRRTWTFALAQRDQSWSIVSAEMR